MAALATERRKPRTSAPRWRLTRALSRSFSFFIGPLFSQARFEGRRSGGGLDQISRVRSISARIFSAITAGHSIGVRWRTFFNTDKVASGMAFWICSDIATGVA